MARLAATAAIALLFLAACGKPAVPAAAPPGADSGAVSAAPAAGAEAPAPAEQLHFSSIIADFAFEVPASWGRRYTVSERSDPPEFPKATQVVEFMYPPDEGGVPPTLLMIVVYRAADWQAVRGTGTGAVVAQKDGRVYVAVPAARDTPFTKGSPDAQRFDAARVTVEQVERAITIR
jgi:hypothetical protein